jgi:hypothetical protein
MHGTRENMDGAPGDAPLGDSMVAMVICSGMNALDDSQRNSTIDSF